MNPNDRIFAGLKADIDIVLDGLDGIVDLCSTETTRLENQETLWPVEKVFSLNMPASGMFFGIPISPALNGIV